VLAARRSGVRAPYAPFSVNRTKSYSDLLSDIGKEIVLFCIRKKRDKLVKTIERYKAQSIDVRAKTMIGEKTYIRLESTTV
jgi:hypothetical protein